MTRGDVMDDPLVAALAAREPLTWFRSGLPTAAATIAGAARSGSGLEPAAVDAAAARFDRFAPWFSRTFPETAPLGGILESPLQRADAARARLDGLLGRRLRGALFVKRDDALPVSGSIKARGGIHEVLEFAEGVASKAGDHGDPEAYASAAFRRAAASHRVVVGSTGNLGLSIGIVSAALGFRTTVHMSQDARLWKRELLRERGVDVREHAGAFTAAVEAGRAEAEQDERAHFVDDEHSVSLFAGYAVAGRRLRRQLEEQGIAVDERHPLVVYLPCGVGGGPGGVAYGVKQEFGDAVRCVFVEPVEAPAMLLGVRTGLHSDICVQDIGLTGRTAADGLAVSRPSRLIGANLHGLVDGLATVEDDTMRAGVHLLHATEDVDVEPSATAGLTLPWRGADTAGPGVDPAWDASDSTTHVVWLTGGSMVPSPEMEGYIEEGASHTDALTAGALGFTG